MLREYIWLGWEPIAVVQGGAVQFVRADHIYRPVFATDAAGDVVWQQSYDPFGRVVSGAGSDARFAGQWFAAENGLHQNWMRDYDATLGRYIQADPLGLVDGASVYGYALHNPSRWSDPRGEETAIQFWSGVGHGGSSFGHVSGHINGTNYSYGPNGMSIETDEKYRGRQSFRGGEEIRIPLTPPQEGQLQACLQSYDTAYSAMGSNCTDPWESCLNSLGLYSQNALTPKGFRDALTRNDQYWSENGRAARPIATPIPGTASSQAFWSPVFPE